MRVLAYVHLENSTNLDLSEISLLSPFETVFSVDDDKDVQLSNQKAWDMVSMVEDKSMVEMILLGLWDRCNEKGLFRYDVTATSTRRVPGSHGFLLQLNEGRLTKKRTTEFKLPDVVMDFDESKFNFTKVNMEEVLFQFDTNIAHGIQIEENATTGRSPNLVLINVSPIEYGHMLLIPRVLDRLPQLVNEENIYLALQFTAAVNNPYFRLNYNSFGAFATINHMHYQGYFAMAPFPAEKAPTVTIERSVFDSNYVRVSKMTNFPVLGWVFEMVAAFGASLRPMSEAIGTICAKLQEMEVPHNLMVTDCGSRILMWPQCYQKKLVHGQVPQKYLDTGVNPAASEIAGHMIFKRQIDYETYTQGELWKFLSLCSLSDDRFDELTDICIRN